MAEEPEYFTAAGRGEEGESSLIAIVHWNRLGLGIERRRIRIGFRKARAVRFRIGRGIRVGNYIRRSSGKAAQTKIAQGQWVGFCDDITLCHGFWDGV
jgi:hypothetical protein